MKPKKIPTFHVNNVYKGEEYELDKKKTVVGWLKYLYLWHEDGTVATPGDHKDYKNAEKTFKSIAKLNQNVDLHDWEEKVTIKKQIELLNLFKKTVSK